MPEPDTKTKHNFELAGEKLTIRFDTWNDAPWVSAIGVVQCKGRIFEVGGVSALLQYNVDERNQVQETLNSDDGISTPSVEVDDVADGGLGSVGTEIGKLAKALHLDPDDPGHYDEVELAVRSASLALARKILSKQGRT